MEACARFLCTLPLLFLTAIFKVGLLVTPSFTDDRGFGETPGQGSDRNLRRCSKLGYVILKMPLTLCFCGDKTWTAESLNRVAAAHPGLVGNG